MPQHQETPQKTTISPYFKAQPIHLAAHDGDLNTVKQLIAEDPNNATLKDNGGNDALYYAMRGQHYDLMRYLLLENPSVAKTVNELSPFDGMTPLTTAATLGDVEAIDILLTDGRADINLQNGEDGSTPLNCAIRQHNVAAVNKLLDLGASASPDLKNREGGTALHHAAMGIRWTLEEQLSLIKRLREAGGDPKCPNTYGKTPIESAEFYSQIHPEVRKAFE